MASTKRTKPAAKADTKPKASAKKPTRAKTAAPEPPPPVPVKEAALKKSARAAKAEPKAPAKKEKPAKKEPENRQPATGNRQPATVSEAPPAKKAGAAHHARNSDELLDVGRTVLGIKDYRAGQREAIDHILAGKDVIAVMPTGSGKSLLYQLPSLVLPGLTVVVSPLIALIKDQVDKMVAKGVAVARIDSTLTVRQRREMDALIHAPGGKLLLTTPERMADPEFRAFLRNSAASVGVSRFVVDEAHCVSQWGHDFRPAYLSLRKALEDVGRPPVLATTATAPPHVREDIKHQLGIEDAEIVTTTFDRPNLHYEVITFPGEDDKVKTLVTLLKKLPRPGIVYCATVKKVEELYESLGRHGIPVAKYHGRMTKNDRDSEQERFMESTDLVMLATNAFGLGVDKKNIRNVLHYHVPGSLESYAQEAGRGGRDGKPSRCVLLFSPDDVAIQEYFLSGTYPTRRQVRAVYEALEAYVDAARGPMRDDTPINVANIALGSGVGQQRTRTVLSLLKDEGFIVEKDGGIYDIADPPLPEDLLNERARQYEARRIMDRQRLDALLAYVKASGCRNQTILAYLGEPDAPTCGRCDNCLRSRDAALAAANEAARLGATVTRVLDEDTTAEIKPRKLMRHRVVRIDQPPPAAVGAAPVPAPVPAAKPAPPAPVVRTRSKAAPAPAPAPTPLPPAPAPAVRRRSAEPPPAAVAAPAPAPAPQQRRPQPQPAAQQSLPIEAATGDAIPPEVRKQQVGAETDEDFEDDDDLDDDEDDDEDDDLDDDDDGEEGDEDEVDDEDDDDLEDDEDDDDLDDEDDDEDDDDEDDEDDDIEVIDRTAAELAEEGVEVDGEITVLARKRQPKVPKPRTPRPDRGAPDQSAAAEARRRRRRRRRKRRAMLPPKAAFTSPVLSTAAPADALPPAVRARQGGGGPVIEYVRGPMRIASAPVASAAPSDSSNPRKGGGKRRHRGGERWGGGAGGAGFHEARPGGGPSSAAERREARRAERLEKKRRRRRRRKRNQGIGMPADGPVSFFQPTGGGGGGPRPDNGNYPNGGQRPFNPNDQSRGQNGNQNGGQNGQPQQVVLGPDGQPLPRKRRRRRRRGRGGRGRPDFRPQGMGPGGPNGPNGNAPQQLEGGGQPPALPPPAPPPPPRDEESQ